jgi:UDP-sugar transporter A1/2/3
MERLAPTTEARKSPRLRFTCDAKAPAATVAAAVLMALQPILVTLAKDPVTHAFLYSVPAAVMLQELLKLSLSLCLLAEDRLRTGRHILHSGSLHELCLYFIPSVGYAFGNQVGYLVLLYLTPVVFQLLSQLKTVFTGVLFWLILRRQLTSMQWLALIVLACGTATSQLSSKACEAPADGLLPDTWTGLLLAVALSVNSAFAGVYNEKLLKGRLESSVHWQNAQMYVWGVALNGGHYLLVDARSVESPFANLNGWACAAIVCNAVMGISIGFVLKFANNIARVYAHGIAMLVTLLISWQIFGTPISLQIVVSMVLVVGSTVQYTIGGGASTAPTRPSDVPRGPTSLH